MAAQEFPSAVATSTTAGAVGTTAAKEVAASVRTGSLAVAGSALPIV